MDEVSIRGWPIPKALRAYAPDGRDEAALVADVLATTGPGPVDERIAGWEAAHERRVAAARARLQEISSGDVFDLAAMSVVVRTVRGVLRA